MNNKGQSLIVFVLLLPIISLIIAITIDLGYLELDKQNYQNEIKNTINYGLKHLDDENIKTKMENILTKNTKGNITVQIDNEIITINIKDKHNSIFNNIFKKHYNIDITYKGYKETGEIIKE